MMRGDVNLFAAGFSTAFAIWSVGEGWAWSALLNCFAAAANIAVCVYVRKGLTQ